MAMLSKEQHNSNEGGQKLIEIQKFGFPVKENKINKNFENF